MNVLLTRQDRVPVLWRALPGLTRYSDAIAAMHDYVRGIAEGRQREAIWLLSSPAGYNPGLASRIADLPAAALMAAKGLAVDTPAGPARAGDWTYHGPGVRGVIVMLDLGKRRRDLTGFVDGLHRWIIAAAADLGIAEARREDFDRAGVWVNGGADKIASIGLRLTDWVTSYGFGLNVDPDLSNFAPIRPCGIDIPGKGITSIAACRRAAAGGPATAPTMDEVDAALRSAFQPIFGSTSLVT
jgi:lipoyl(octanoyl) transferase